MGPLDPEIDLAEYSYVLVVPSPAQGTQINLEANRLLNLFGKYGQGQLIQGEKGIVVKFGEVNRFEFSPPRIVFHATTPDVLFELYRNALNFFLPQFKSQPSRAFGINLGFRLNSEVLATEILNRLFKSNFPDNFSFSNATIKQKETSVTFGILGDSQSSRTLEVKFNNHLETPSLPFYELPELRERFEHFESENRKLLLEIVEWLNTAHA